MTGAQYKVLAKYVSRRSGNEYFISRRVDKSDYQGQLSCNCPGWTKRVLYKDDEYGTPYRTCKHLRHFAKHDMRFVQLDDIPHYEDTVAMDYGNNIPATNEWMKKHLIGISL
jgi:hypothetical protein